MVLASYTAIFDTGTSLILGPDFEVKQVLNKINFEQKCKLDEYLYCDCADLKKYPKIEFVLQGVVFDLLPENYMMKNNGKCQVLILGSAGLNM